MEDTPLVGGYALLRDIHYAQESVRAGTIQDARQQKLYKQWSDFCATLAINPALQDPSVPRIELLKVYGRRIRNTQYSKRQVGQLGKGSVSQAWEVITATNLLACLPYPRSLPTPKPMSDWTCDSLGSLKPIGSRTLLSNGKKQSPSASFTPSFPE